MASYHIDVIKNGVNRLTFSGERSTLVSILVVFINVGL